MPKLLLVLEKQKVIFFSQYVNRMQSFPKQSKIKMRHLKKKKKGLKRTSSTLWPCALNHHFQDVSKHFCPVTYSLDISVFCKECQLKKKKLSRCTLTLVKIALSRLTGFISLANLSVLTRMVKDTSSRWPSSPGWSLPHLQKKANLAPAGIVCPRICSPGWGLRTLHEALGQPGNHSTRSASSLTTCVGSIWPALYLHKLPNGLWHHWRLRGRHST